MFFSGAMMANEVPAGELALTGPSPRLDPARLPLRGDLAHVKLAGTCFVPHYAAPMRMAVVGAGAALAERPGGEPLTVLAPGSGFDVLDIAGDWAWGQVDEGPAVEGLVGYLALSALDRP